MVFMQYAQLHRVLVLLRHETWKRFNGNLSSVWPRSKARAGDISLSCHTDASAAALRHDERPDAVGGMCESTVMTSFRIRHHSTTQPTIVWRCVHVIIGILLCSALNCDWLRNITNNVLQKQWLCLHGKAPSYLTDCCTPISDVASRRHLRSASRRQLLVPRHNLSTYGRRVFSVARPAAWNCLCDELREPLLTANSFR